MIVKRVKPVLAAIAAVWLLAESPAALSAAQYAIGAWYESFLPAMLPFFLLTPFLSGQDAQAFFRRAFEKPLRVLFRLPGEAAGAVLTGFVAGSPAGSIALSAVGESMNAGEYERCAFLASGLSPAFLITSVGVGYMGAQKVGWILAASHILSLLVSGILLRGFEADNKGKGAAFAPRVAQDGILTAFSQCVRVCGWMVVFGVFSALAANALSAFVPGWCIGAISEIAGGARKIARLPLSVEIRTLLLALFTGFGGLCVGAQCVSVTGVSPLRMLFAKALHACISALICFGLLRLPDCAARLPEMDPLALSGFAAALFAACACARAIWIGICEPHPRARRIRRGMA